MGIDVEINGSIMLVTEGRSNPKKIIKKLEKWIQTHKDDFYGWNIEYSEDRIDIEFESPKRGPLVNYITGLVKFLKYCKKYKLYAMDTLRYMESWGDYAMGFVWISTEKEVAIISGMTNNGDRIDQTIEWKNV